MTFLTATWYLLEVETGNIGSQAVGGTWYNAKMQLTMCMWPLSFFTAAKQN
jgi:hypothetical protein